MRKVHPLVTGDIDPPSLNRDNVRIPVTGAIAVAFTNTPPPRDASKALGNGWVGLGYITDTGITETYTNNPTGIATWRGNRVGRVADGETGLNFEFECMEENKASLFLGYREQSGLTADGGDQMYIGGPGGFDLVLQWVFQWVDYAGDVTRVWIPRGQMVSMGAREYVSDSATVLPFKVECYPARNPLGPPPEGGPTLFPRAVLFNSRPPLDGAPVNPLKNTGPFSRGFMVAFDGALIGATDPFAVGSGLPAFSTPPVPPGRDDIGDAQRPRYQ